MDQICSRHTLRLLIALLASGLAWAQTPTPSTPAPKPSTAAAKSSTPTAKSSTPGAKSSTPAPTPAASPARAASKPATRAASAPKPGDKVVLKIGVEKVTATQFETLIQSLNPQAQHTIATQPQGKKQFGDQYATVVALAQQAHLHHLDQKPEFAQRLALQKQQMEAQFAFQEITQQAEVTPGEVEQYYTAHTADYDQIAVRQFVVRKKPPAPPAPPADPAHPAPTPAPATGPGLSPEDAKTRAEAIRKEVAAGTDIKKVLEDFKAPNDVMIDPETRTVRHGGMRPDMEKVAFALKDGEVSEPIDVPQALIFFQVTRHSHSELKDVGPDIEKNLRQQKVDAALADLKKSAGVWMDDQYFAAAPKPAEEPSLGAPTVKLTPKP